MTITPLIRAQLIANGDFIVAGQRLAQQLLSSHPDLQTRWLFGDGDLVLQKQTLVEIKGPFEQLQRCQRHLLHSLQSLSGLATLTRLFANLLRGSKVQMLAPADLTPHNESQETEAFMIGAQDLAAKDKPLHVDRHWLCAMGGYKAAAAEYLVKDRMNVAVDCLDNKDIHEALACGFYKLVLPSTGFDLVAHVPSDGEVIARGDFDDQCVLAWRQLAIPRIQPEYFWTTTPRAEMRWTVECL
jgi:nicotinate-nucleotide pyrophosphorylase (carboxylating)